jgi:hypothetical protein
MALDRSAGAAGAWLLAAVAFAVGFALTAGLTPLERTVGGFLVAETTAFLTLVVVGSRSPR